MNLPFRLAPLLALLFSFTARADLYQWQDASGHVHFSDRKPDQAQAVKTLATPTPTSSAKDDADAGPGDSARRERQRRLDEVIRKETEEKAEADQKAKAEKAARQAQCDKLRAHQQEMDGRRLYQTNENGERVYMDDKTRGEYEQQIRQTLAEKCS